MKLNFRWPWIWARYNIIRFWCTNGWSRWSNSKVCKYPRINQELLATSEYFGASACTKNEVASIEIDTHNHITITDCPTKISQNANQVGNAIRNIWKNWSEFRLPSVRNGIARIEVRSKYSGSAKNQWSSHCAHRRCESCSFLKKSIINSKHLNHCNILLSVSSSWSVFFQEAIMRTK